MVVCNRLRFNVVINLSSFSGAMLEAWGRTSFLSSSIVPKKKVGERMKKENGNIRTTIQKTSFCSAPVFYK